MVLKRFLVLTLLLTAREVSGLNISDITSVRQYIVDNLNLREDGDITEKVLRLQSIVCPASVRCTSKTYQLEPDPLTAVLDINQFKGCCLPCSCNDTCVDIGNCCPDVAESKEASQHARARCVRPDIWTHTDGGPGDGREYRMFTDCAEDSSRNNSDAVVKCREPDIMDMSQIIPVSSKDTGKTYWNRYCAACNGDSSNTVSWYARIFSILEIFSISTFSSWETLASLYRRFGQARIGMTFHPPAAIEGIVMQVACPVGDSVNPDCSNDSLSSPSIQRACSHYQLPFETGEEKTNYANIFCSLCHPAMDGVLVIDEDDKACQFIDPEPDLGGFGFQSITGLIIPITSAVTDTSEETDSQPVTGPCNCSQFWDVYKMACRPLRCPSWEFRHGCSCLQLVQTLSGVAMRTTLSIKLGNCTDTFEVPGILYTIMNDINFELRNALEHISKIEGQTVYGKRGTDSKVVAYIYVPTVFVEPGFDTKAVLRGLLNMSMTVSVDDRWYDVAFTDTVYINDTEAVDLSDGTQLTLIMSGMGVKNEVLLSKLLFCEQVSLEIDEYEITDHVLRLHVDNETKIFRYEVVSEASIVQVCVGDYLAKEQFVVKVNGGASIEFSVRIQLALLMVSAVYTPYA